MSWKQPKYLGAALLHLHAFTSTYYWGVITATNPSLGTLQRLIDVTTL
jgi:hypothetical protein